MNTEELAAAAEALENPQLVALLQKALVSASLNLKGAAIAANALVTRLPAAPPEAPEEPKVLEEDPPLTVPATPKDTGPESLPANSGKDRILSNGMMESIIVAPGDNVMEACGGTLTNTQLVVKGDVGPINIGGPGLSMGEGCSEIVAYGGAQSVQGTVGGLKIYPGVKGQLRLGDGLRVRPAMNGDYAPIRSIGAIPDFHLILQDAELFAPMSWTGYNGFGGKWGIHVSGCILTILEVHMAPFREHSVYGHNMQDVFVDGLTNSMREMLPPGGSVITPLGNGRTGQQYVNRIPIGERTPGQHAEGGPPSTGKIVIRNSIARGTGWEGLAPQKVGAGGVLLPPLYGKGGGSAFTIAGHTGASVEISGCRTEMTYTNLLAVFVDQAKQSVWPELNQAGNNPLGYRSWMFGPLGWSEDPTRGEIYPDQAWATRKLVMTNNHQDRQGSRTPALVAGVREIIHDGSLDMQLDYQEGVQKAEQVATIG